MSQFDVLIKNAEARLVEADEVYRSAGGPQLLAGSFTIAAA
jgi:hypothetical protein